jgi:hypothetical protein
VLAIALKLGLLALVLAVFAAVFSVLAAFPDHALAAGVSALCLGHADLLSRFAKPGDLVPGTARHTSSTTE